MSDLLQKRVGGELEQGYTFPARFEGGELDPPPNAFPLPRPAPFHTPFLKISDFNFDKFIVCILGHPGGLSSGCALLPSSAAYASSDQALRIPGARTKFLKPLCIKKEKLYIPNSRYKLLTRYLPKLGCCIQGGHIFNVHWKILNFCKNYSYFYTHRFRYNDTRIVFFLCRKIRKQRP
ncbi:hypothetical protein LEP1GSC196_1049 [Leptospira meyeri serovar Semaranga str. Veldrot Semarang 173]|nr:hypothetical protein LEP1GSC196_1049 [Leptospira meyeri serovar Semaranga str. Veldrot Semarang 173]